MTYIDIVRAQLVIDEGRRAKPYFDNAKPPRVTIGIGRNLTDDGLSPAEIDFLFGNDIALAEFIAKKLFPTFYSLSDARKAVLINMAFNMGEETLAQFHRTIQAVSETRYADAAQYMLESQWAKEVGNRAQRLATAMRGG